MKSFSIPLLFIIFFFSGCGIFVSKPVKPELSNASIDSLAKLQDDVETVLQDGLFTTASIGIKVVSVETGEVVISKNPFKLHHPASTTKLFTTATALARLGSNFQFETILYTDKEPKTHTVGNVYLKGKGDPLLQTKDINELVHGLIRSGVKSVEGNIVVDETYFDTIREGPGWMWDDKPFHLNALSIRSIEPDVLSDNRAITCGHLLKAILLEQGIIVKGDVVSGTVPSDASSIAIHNSLPLADIIKLMNKPSDNWIAEFLFKTVGAEVKGEPGTWKKGREAVADFLTEILGEPSAHRFVDGSGLSRYNLVNAELLTRLLVYMQQNFELMPEFITSLPIAGVDGTLRNRMQGMYAEKILRAKTGTLSGVSALAGYTVTVDGEVFAFGIIISHYVGSSTTARSIQDKIGNLITEFSRKSTEVR